MRIKERVELLTYPDEMGEDEAKQAGFAPVVVGAISSGKTTSDDTRKAATKMRDLKVDLLLFAGGDGTAKDICSALRGSNTTVLGIPTGVKMHSGVFATNPRNAGEVAVAFLTSTRQNVVDAEVMDIDESSFRQGVIAARLHGFLRIPEERRFIQSAKAGGIQTEKEVIQGIAADLAANEEKDCMFIFGPGTTTRDILSELGLKKTLLGIDVVLGGKVIASDINELQLLRLIEGRKNVKIVVTVIGGQGYIFGRGNQQISPAVIKRVGKANIIVIASKQKLASLEGRPLLVDTGSAEVDKILTGYLRVTTGLNDYVMYKVGS